MYTPTPRPPMAREPGPSLHLLSAGERRGVDRLLDLWDVLVDPRVGIVKDVFELPLDEDDPPLFHYLSTACDAGAFNRFRNFGNNGGAATNRYVAMAKAVGETVERYCGAIYRYEDLETATWRDLDGRGERAVHPELFRVYLPHQRERERFPWRPFEEDSPAHWVRGRSLADDEPVWLPAAAVFIPYHYPRSRELPPVLQPISTGIACHGSVARATVGGLCEVAERDAFTITWQARLARPRLRRQTLPPSCKDLLDRFAAAGVEVELMDVTNDMGVPVVLSVGLSGAETSPAVTVAASADPSPEVAAIKSLEELAHTRKYAKQVMEYLPELPVEVEEEHPQVSDQMFHLRFYCPQSSREYAEFAWSSDERRDLADLPDLSCDDPGRQVELLVETIDSGTGLEPVSCEVTTPEVEALGLRVVRTLIPGAHPLYMGHRNRALANPRLYEVPAKLGHTPPELGRDNPYPHPFP